MANTPHTTVRLNREVKQTFTEHSNRTGDTLTSLVRELATILKHPQLIGSFKALVRKARELDVEKAKSEEEAIEVVTRR